jgi:hypothetical protein
VSTAAPTGCRAHHHSAGTELCFTRAVSADAVGQEMNRTAAKLAAPLRLLWWPFRWSGRAAVRRMHVSSSARGSRGCSLLAAHPGRTYRRWSEPGRPIDALGTLLHRDADADPPSLVDVALAVHTLHWITAAVDQLAADAAKHASLIQRAGRPVSKPLEPSGYHTHANTRSAYGSGAKFAAERVGWPYQLPVREVQGIGEALVAIQLSGASGSDPREPGRRSSGR